MEGRPKDETGHPFVGLVNQVIFGGTFIWCSVERRGISRPPPAILTLPCRRFTSRPSFEMPSFGKVQMPHQSLLSEAD